MLALAPLPLRRPVTEYEARADEIVIRIDRDAGNLNLRELFEAKIGRPPMWYERVRFVIAEGVTIRSRSPDLPAMRAGEWPAQPIIFARAL